MGTHNFKVVRVLDKGGKMKTILLTGVAGFIASKTAELLSQKKNYSVVGIDNINDYYDISLKNNRLKSLKKFKNFTFKKIDIEDRKALGALFKKYKFDAVINLAARAGVRYSMENPFIYFSTNSTGTLNLLEECRKHTIKKFVLASTSSLYAGQKMPFSEKLAVNTPISPYAASKKAAEATCYTYHYLYDIDITILRYFTVYGPSGRPDMSIFRFIKWIDEGIPIELFGDGSQSRDFTYVDDIALGTIKALKKVNFQVINLGGNEPFQLNHAIKLIEGTLGKKAKIKYFPFHKADLRATSADISKAKQILEWHPKINLEEGIRRSVDWHKNNIRWLKDISL